MLKSKNVWSSLFLLALVTALCVPLSTGQEKNASPLVVCGGKLYASHQKLLHLSIKLTLLTRIDKPVLKDDLVEGVSRVDEIIGDVSKLLDYESQLMIMIPHLRE